MKLQPVELKESEDGSEDDYEACSAFRTMMEAEKHKKNPEMMDRVSKVAERRMMEAQSLASSLKPSKKMMSADDVRSESKKKFPANKRWESRA